MADQPNIILLFTDQQRWDSIACVHNGATDMKTPSFDRLCAEGLRFDRAYTPNPVCIPARYNMLTGLTARYHGHPSNNGSSLPQGIPCLPQILANAGYLTHAIGKMHFRPMREHHGYHRMELMEETPAHRNDDDYLKYLQSVGCGVMAQHGVRHLLYHQPQRSLVPEEHHGSKWVADRGITFLEENAEIDRPFFLKLSWIAPHPPENIPERLADMYKDAKLPERIKPSPDAPEDKHDMPPYKRGSNGLGDGMVEGDEARLRRHKEHYYASVAFVDEQIGRVLEKLDELGIADNTLIIATSDHGEMLGDLDAFQKSCHYESASHIPMIMRWPGKVEAGAVNAQHFVDLNDILPTFLDAAGVAYPGPHELPGASLLNLDEGKDRTVQYMEYGEGPGRWCAIRNKKYKYAFAMRGGWQGLYDLENDPHEQNNLLTDGVPEEWEPIRKEMFDLLVQYEKRWGMPGMVIWDDLMKFYEYPLRKSQMNPQFPPGWINNLPPKEREALGDPLQEIIDVVKDEPTCTLGNLSLDIWQQKCNIPDEFIKKIKDEGL